MFLCQLYQQCIQVYTSATNETNNMYDQYNYCYKSSTTYVTNTGTALPTCLNGQILKMVSGVWSCADAPVAAGDHFGGTYSLAVASIGQTGGTCNRVNPLTGSCTCLSGYTPTLAVAGVKPGPTSVDNLYVCSK